MDKRICSNAYEESASDIVWDVEEVFSLLWALVDILIHSSILGWDIDNVPSCCLQACLWHSDFRVCVWLWQHSLNMISVEFSIVKSKFRSFKVLLKDIAKFGRCNWSTSQMFFISMIVCWDIQRWYMPIKQIFIISSYVTHTVDNCCRQLTCSCLNCYFTIMHHSKVSCTHSGILLCGLNEVNLELWG